MLRKMDEIISLIQSANCYVLGISETWLDDLISDNETNIPGYIVHRKYRNRDGDCVCLYVKETLPSTYDLM